MRLNLGCADTRIPGFLGVDIAPGPEVDQVADLEAPWPWPESSVEEIVARDVCEHIGDCGHASDSRWRCRVCGPALLTAIPNPYMLPLRHSLGRIHFMNELWRVLIPGGRATIETPNAARGVGFWQDCTHKTGWCLSSFKYFEAGAFAHTRLAKSYGITAAFRVVSLREYETSGEDSRERAWKIEACLESVKTT